MSAPTRTIEQRIHRLETQNRMLMAGLLLLLAVLVAATENSSFDDGTDKVTKTLDRVA